MGILVGSRARLTAAAVGTLGIVGGLMAAGSATHVTSVDQARADPSQPNVVVIETDDQTVESMRIMSNVNSLIGDQGTTFNNSFVNFSLCCPSRATFLTGQYAHNHGVLSNAPPTGGFATFEKLHGDNNLAVWLQDAGYFTGMIGKYLNQYSNKAGIPPGWSDWEAVAPGDQTVYNYTLNDNGTLVHYGSDPADFKQDVLTSRAVDFIDPKASEPELGSVMAQAPIFSSVSSSPAQRSFWAIVPLLLMAAEVSPIETPMAVTMPGQMRHSSMIGMRVSDDEPPSPSRFGFSGGVSPLASASATAFSKAICLANRSFAIESMPNSANSLRRTA